MWVGVGKFIVVGAGVEKHSEEEWEDENWRGSKKEWSKRKNRD